ncbi:MAG: hypothetical protein AB2A00_37165 [Myxococcota bacterium]
MRRTLTAQAALASYVWTLVLWPVTARAEERVAEPGISSDGQPWYDAWWTDANADLPLVPQRLREDLGSAHADVVDAFEHGIRVGDTLVVPGGPELNAFLRKHAEQGHIQLRDTVVLLPEHLQAARGELSDAATRTAQVARENAAHTAHVDEETRKEMEENSKQADQLLRESGTRADATAAAAVKETDEGLRVAREKAEAGHRVATEQMAASIVVHHLESTHSARALVNASADMVPQLARWTAQQGPQGLDDTQRWTRNVATSTVEMATDLALWTGDGTVGAVEDTQRALRTIRGEERRDQAAIDESAAARTNVINRETDSAVRVVTEETFAYVRPALASQWRDSQRDAKALWQLGYHDYLEGGMRLAGDNYFAGDVEGILMGTAYSVTGVAQGVTHLFVIHPMAQLVHAVAGAGQAGGLAALGVGGVVVQAGRGVARHVGNQVARVGSTVGNHVISRALEVGTLGLGTAGAIATATTGTVMTTGVVLGGSALTVGAAGAGVTRTVGAVGAGALATVMAPSMGLAAGGLFVGTRGVAWLGIDVVTGTLRGAEAIGTGAAESVTYAVTGTSRVIAARVADLALRMGIPALGVLVTAARFARVGAVAVGDNLVATPLAAGAHMLGGTLGAGWQLIRDPIQGTTHLVVGATGYSFGVLGLTSVTTTRAFLHALVALGVANVEFIHHGGKLVVSGAVGAFENVTAPLRFDRQNQWKAEREPQLREMLERQPPDVKSRLGTDVSYIRVVFSGPDRGKVHFFTMKIDGDPVRFYRHVGPDCAITYRSDGRNAEVLDSGWYDVRCQAQHEGNEP